MWQHKHQHKRPKHRHGAMHERSSGEKARQTFVELPQHTGRRAGGAHDIPVREERMHC